MQPVACRTSCLQAGAGAGSVQYAPLLAGATAAGVAWQKPGWAKGVLVVDTADNDTRALLDPLMADAHAHAHTHAAAGSTAGGRTGNARAGAAGGGRCVIRAPALARRLMGLTARACKLCDPSGRKPFATDKLLEEHLK